MSARPIDPDLDPIGADWERVTRAAWAIHQDWTKRERQVIEDFILTVRHSISLVPADPIHTRPNGKTVVFMDELSRDDRAYLHGYGVLSPEMRAELQEFAAHLKAKAQSRKGGTS